jgi:hypothetical protein
MKRLPLLSLSLFVIACCLPALEFNESGGGQDAMWGAHVLAVGWSGILAGVFAWYANPFWVLGLTLALLRKPRLAALAGGIAIAIACTTFSLFGRALPADEGDVAHMTLVRFLPGCYLWMASLVTLPVTALLSKPHIAST